MSASANLHAEGKLPSDQLHLLAHADLSITYLKENAIWLALIAPILPAVANQNILLHFLCTAVWSNRSNWISILLEKCGNMFFTELDINLTLQWWMGVIQKYTDIQLLKRSVWKKLLLIVSLLKKQNNSAHWNTSGLSYISGITLFGLKSIHTNVSLEHLL